MQTATLRALAISERARRCEVAEWISTRNPRPKKRNSWNWVECYVGWNRFRSAAKVWYLHSITSTISRRHLMIAW